MRLADAALHVLGKVPSELKERERADLDMLTDWACQAVDQYLGGSPAPESIRKAAALRLAYYDHHSRLSRQPADGGMLGRPPRGVSLDPLVASGAAALLTRYKRRRATA